MRKLSHVLMSRKIVGYTPIPAVSVSCLVIQVSPDTSRYHPSAEVRCFILRDLRYVIVYLPTTGSEPQALQEAPSSTENSIDGTERLDKQ